jgi:hypothetical protein
MFIAQEHIPVCRCCGKQYATADGTDLCHPGVDSYQYEDCRRYELLQADAEARTVRRVAKMSEVNAGFSDREIGADLKSAD